MKKKNPQRFRVAQTNNLFNNVSKLEPLTETQSLIIQANEKDKNLVIYGYPGTGKTYLACACAIQALMQGQVEQIRIIRSAVASRDMGFLPGTEAEKMMAYERPYIATINSLMKRDDGYSLLKQKGMLAFESSSFLRGMTYDNTFLIIDEYQNLDFEEISTTVTRAGENTKVWLCGDITQTDLIQGKDRIGYYRAMQVFELMPKYFTMIHMEIEDIVRSDLVKAWIIAAEKTK